MIEIKDFELIQDIKILFEKPIIILGAGHIGWNIYELLNEIELEEMYIYDANIEEKIISNHVKGIFSWNEVKLLTTKREFILIVATEKYREEMLDELSSNGICGYICTWYGVQRAIEINIDSSWLKEEFRDYWWKRRCLAKTAELTSRNYTIFKKMLEKPESILVFVPQKVGSLTICKTLDCNNVANIHLHECMTLKDGYLWEKYINFLKKYYEKEKLRIITLVRDPIGRSLSNFLQSFNVIGVRLNVDRNIILSAKDYVLNDLETNFEFEWFNKEIKEFSGIDIYKYPFDREKGYAWIKQGNCEILVLKLELLNQNVEIIGNFIGKKIRSLENTNIGNEKCYKYIYQKLKKELKFSKSLVETTYMKENYFKHFYTEEEGKEFSKRWSL